jgi:hypothetical protein
MTPPRPEPSSSRMVASYLTDVEKLLEAQCWDAALCEAYDLPRIAAALTDPTLQSSAPQQKTWCEQWIRPVEDDHDGLDYESLRRTVCEHLEHEAPPRPSVPTRALRRLRLSRHVRTAPRGFFQSHTADDDPEASQSAQICTALVEAARR